MVEFSEIIGSKLEKEKKALRSRSEERPETFRMADLELIDKEEGRKVPEASITGTDIEKVKAFYHQLLMGAIDIRDRVKKGQGINPSPALSILHQVINGGLIDGLYDYAIPIDRDEGLPSHTVSVTLAAMKLAKGMGYGAKGLLKVGLAAFLENVGMYKVPERILEKKGRLSDDEFAQIRKHPEIGAQIISNMGRSFDAIAEIAFQVHERYDGSGYPNGLKGKEISEIALIIGIVDTYMAMIKNRPHRDRHMQPAAVKAILALRKGEFPPGIVKEFLNQFSLFPVNTYVKLNNKSIGRVVSTSSTQPLRPTIELLFDGLGNRLGKGKIVHLSELPLLHIVDTIDEKGLPE